MVFRSLILSACLISLLTGVRAQERRVKIYPETYEQAIRNPLMGFREFFSPGVDKKRAQYPYPYGTMVKEYMQWNMLEDRAGDGLDKIIAYSNHRWKGVEDMNVKVIPRVYLVWVEPWHGGKPKDPKNRDDMNGWHWPSDIPGQKSPYHQIPGSVGAAVAPEDKNTPITGGYFDPAFADRVKMLVEKIGKAWDNDPRVAYVEMGIVGEWGEHHDPDLSTYWPPHDEPEHVANRTWVPGLEKVLGDAFTAAFKNKKVMVRYAYEFKDYEFGIYWDSWSQKEENVRGYGEMLKLGDRWKRQPIGGEITWNWGSLGKFKNFEAVVADREFHDLTIEQIRNLHCNHLGGITWANFDDPVFKKNAEILQRSMGYRYVLSEFNYPQNIQKDKPFKIAFKLTNEGSSPFYYNWPVEISLLDAKTKEKVWSKQLNKVNIADWMPGENWSVAEQRYLVKPPLYNIEAELTMDKSIPKGKYIIAISVLDPAGLKPSLRFSNKNYFNGGRHPMGYIGLSEKVKTFTLDASEFNDIQADTSLKYEAK
uniref:DUF4832 domain-containing protein n=1 Tax=Pedobacter schmidteae TaxID=2201271 RepID=UPI000EAFCF5C|nr:DUF4832 domain-containing protein [Pedobacter schmidteae]